jgi:hypothetical protein
MLDTQVAGIRARHWVDFFRMYSESKTIDEIERKLERARQGIERKRTPSEDQQRAVEILEELLQLITQT